MESEFYGVTMSHGISGNDQAQSSPASSGRKLSYPPEIDEQLVHWVKTEQNAGVVMSPDILRREALRLIQPYCYEFKASTGWLDKFLTRHKLVLHATTLRANGNGYAQKEANGVEELNKLKNSIAERFPSLEPTTQPPPKLLPVSEIDSMTSNSMVNTSLQNEDDLDDDDDDDENETKKEDGGIQKPVNPERLKAFNMFVRLFIDENLDRLVPISKQPKEKINAIIMSCQRQFPDFSDRARKRIRTYLKSCRRSTRLKEPSSKPSMTHIPASQLTEVNNILAQACENETQEVAKRQRLETLDGSIAYQSKSSIIDEAPTPQRKLSAKVAELQKAALTKSRVHKEVFPAFLPSSLKSPILKLSSTEVGAVRSLIDGYRQSASFLHRSADELERLLKHCEAYTDETIVEAGTKNVETVKAEKVEKPADVKQIPDKKSAEAVINKPIDDLPDIHIPKSVEMMEKHTAVSEQLTINVPASTIVEKNEEKREMGEVQPAPELLHLHLSSAHASEHVHSPSVTTQRSPSHHAPQYQLLQTPITISIANKQMLTPHLLSMNSDVVHTSSQQHTQLHSSHSKPQQNIILTHTGHNSNRNPSPLQSSAQSQQLNRNHSPSPSVHTQQISHIPSPTQNIHSQQIGHSPSTQGSLHSQQMYAVRQNQQQSRHLSQQLRPHSLSTGHHQPSAHHQTVFNFDSSAQQMLDVRQQQHIHQRLSPHPINYHSLMAPVSSPHLHDMPRQSHLQDLSRQSLLQDLSRRGHSDYQHSHGIVFDPHQSH